MRGLYSYKNNGLRRRLFHGIAAIAMSMAIGLYGAADTALAASGTVSGTNSAATASNAAAASNNAASANSSKTASTAAKTTNNSRSATIATVPKLTTASPVYQSGNDMAAMKITLENAIANENYGVYLWYPSVNLNGNPILINNKQLRAASMIKVFVMSYAYEQVKAGRLDMMEEIVLKDAYKVGGQGSINSLPEGTKLTIRDLVVKMITESDDTATNILIDKLGMDNINNYCRQNGFTSTLLRRKMMDEEAVRQGRENITTPGDLGKWFSLVYRHELVGEPYDSAMVTTLLMQEDMDGIPAALNSTDKVAHKTGELENLCDDGGIVFSSTGDFVLVVMDDGVNRANALTKIHSLTTLAKAYTVIPEDIPAGNGAASASSYGSGTVPAGPVVQTGAAANTATPAPATTPADNVSASAAAPSVEYTVTEIAWNPNWRYADMAAIHTDAALLYKSKAAVRKNVTVALNAGHGTLNGAAEEVYCHPDGSPKTTGGSTDVGAIKAPSIVAGTVLNDGTPEAKANLKVALGVKEALLNAGYDVLMLRENDNTRLDNVARAVLANNNANCHISIHFDSTNTNKGFFCINVPENDTYRTMEPVASLWREDNKLAADIVQGALNSGIKVFATGLVGIDLTQTSYSTVPSVDVEVGDKASVPDYTLIKQVSNAIIKGLGYYYGK